jgi:hypothetical protein
MTAIGQEGTNRTVLGALAVGCARSARSVAFLCGTPREYCRSTWCTFVQGLLETGSRGWGVASHPPTSGQLSVACSLARVAYAINRSVMTRAADTAGRRPTCPGLVNMVAFVGLQAVSDPEAPHFTCARVLYSPNISSLLGRIRFSASTAVPFESRGTACFTGSSRNAVRHQSWSPYAHRGAEKEQSWISLVELKWIPHMENTGSAPGGRQGVSGVESPATTKDVASQVVPESCAAHREVCGEALTGVRVGQPLSHEMFIQIRVPTPLLWRKATRAGASSRVLVRPGGVTDLACTYAPCMGTGRSANRPSAGAIRWRSASGRRGAEADDDGDAEVSTLARSSCEAGEQSPSHSGAGVGGAKGRGRGERGPVTHVPDA